MSALATENSAVPANRNADAIRRASTALKASATFWLVIAIVGQWAFLVFILTFYGSTSLAGNFEAWSKNTILPKGYIANDTTGNRLFAAHALIAAVVAFGGVLQLIPKLRARFPIFHRWNGRVFLTAIIAASLSGIAMNWWRDTGTLAISINGCSFYCLHGTRGDTCNCVISWHIGVGRCAHLWWQVVCGFCVWDFSRGSLSPRVR